MSTLNRTGRIIVFDDSPSNRNPKRRNVDWVQDVQSFPVTNPQGATEFMVDPRSEVTLFSGARSLGTNGSTQFALSLSALDPSRYRLAWTGTGADPAFRTARSVAVATGDLVLTLQANQTLTVTSTLGAVFGAVVEGDTVLVPGVLTGDAALFDPLNEGEWTVLSATSTTLVLARMTGEIFSGATETVSIAANTQFLVYSAAGVQVGDRLDLTAGFATTALHAYSVLAVSSKWVEFASSLPLAAQTVVPGASGVSVYSSAKRWIYIETDQEIAVKLNGNTGEHDRVEPMIAGDAERRGWFEKLGTVYSVVVKNRSTARAKIILITAE